MNAWLSKNSFQDCVLLVLQYQNETEETGLHTSKAPLYAQLLEALFTY